MKHFSLRTMSPSNFSHQIQTMFSGIASKYDFLNRILSFGRDRYWRKTAVDALEPAPEKTILDLATGTADIALEIAARFPNNIKVYGVDISSSMLRFATSKAQRKELDRIITFQVAKGERLPFSNEKFHGVIVAFGVRNFMDITEALKEIFRILKPGYRLVILEFSVPKNLLLRWAYLLYFQAILPWIGKIISGHRTAYQYLVESVITFPNRKDFVEIFNLILWDCFNLLLAVKNQHFLLQGECR